MSTPEFEGQAVPYSSTPIEKTQEETLQEKHEKIAILIFIAGFFCQCVWLGSLYFRNSQNKRISRFRCLSQCCFWTVVLVEFVLFWIGLVLIMCLVQPIYTPAYNPTFPIGEWFAVLFALAFGFIILFDVIMMIWKKFEEKGLRKAIALGKGIKGKIDERNAAGQNASQPNTESLLTSNSYPEQGDRV